MAKIVALGEYGGKTRQKHFEKQLQAEINKVEEKLNLEEDSLLVLTDMNAITLGDHLLDARESINKALDILGIEEGGELPDGLQ